jgi:tetratricopeptide (TPR) repeat protein
VSFGRPEEALETCRQQISFGGASAAVLDVMARAYSRMNRDQEAIESWQRALTIHPQARFCRELAAEYDHQRDAEQARRQRGLAEALDGIQCYRSHDIPQAREHLLKAVQLEPDYAPAWYYKGCIEEMEDDPAGAAGSFARCLELNPGHGRAFVALRAVEKHANSR